MESSTDVPKKKVQFHFLATANSAVPSIFLQMTYLYSSLLMNNAPLWPGAIAPACNPSYSEAREQEDHVSMLAQPNGSLENTQHNSSLSDRVGPWFNHQYCQNNNNNTLLFVHTHFLYPLWIVGFLC
jgi:hypothetical protein